MDFEVFSKFSVIVVKKFGLDMGICVWRYSWFYYFVFVEFNEYFFVF